MLTELATVHPQQPGYAGSAVKRTIYIMASPWLPGNQATASAPRPLNSSSKPLHQQLPGPGKGERAASRLRASEVGT